MLAPDAPRLLASARTLGDPLLALGNLLRRQLRYGFSFASATHGGDFRTSVRTECYSASWVRTFANAMRPVEITKGRATTSVQRWLNSQKKSQPRPTQKPAQ